MKRSWLERNPLWKIPVGCVILCLLLGAVALIVMTGITSYMRHTEVYKQAVAQATANSQVRERIGEPLKPDWLISGEVHLSGSGRTANLAIPVSGPRGRGRIRAVAVKSGGVWRFTYLTVEVRSPAAYIDLLSLQQTE
jgi:hypothetical protein